MTLQDQYDIQNIWWEKPGCLYPFLIRVDGTPAGFAFVATPPHCSDGIEFFMHEFFLLQPFRGMGIAEQFAKSIFGKFIGKWELFTNPAEKNKIGESFWRKTVANYTEGNYQEMYGETFDGYKLIFQFSNLRNSLSTKLPI